MKVAIELQSAIIEVIFPFPVWNMMIKTFILIKKLTDYLKKSFLMACDNM